MPRGCSVFVSLFMVLGLAGCYEYRVKYDGWETFRNQVGADPAGGAVKKDPSAGAQPAAARGGWAILVETFDGASRYRKATDLVRRLSNRHAVTDLWIEEKDGKTKVFRGRYESLTDLEGQKVLLQTRAIEDDGEKPYEDVELVSLSDDRAQRTAGSSDLRVHSGQGFYTLQFGFYDDSYGPDFRDAAEQAIAALRAEGHRVFYYHGPNRSLLTADLFTEADFEQDGPVRVYGARMLALQERFPYNLANGRTILENIGEGPKKEKREQPSFIVKAP